MHELFQPPIHGAAKLVFFAKLFLDIALPSGSNTKHLAGLTTKGCPGLQQEGPSNSCTWQGWVCWLKTGALEGWSEDLEQLTDLLVRSEDIKSFLDGLADLGAVVLSRVIGTRIECALILERRKRTPIMGGGVHAMFLGRIEQALGEGPCVDSLASGRTVVLDDAVSSPQ